MPLNLLKNYAALLDLVGMPPQIRIASLRGVFRRDIEDNSNFNFRTKKIRPIKLEGKSPMDILFMHLTHEDEEIVDGQMTFKRRSNFEINRAQRLHWLRHHIEERQKENVKIFSALERDAKKRKDVVKTYIYDEAQEYVIVLEPQRSNLDYYLLTAYYFNKPFGKKKIEKLFKNKLPDIY